MQIPFQGESPIESHALWRDLKAKWGVRESIPMLPWAGVVGKEIRRLYFHLAVNDDGQLNSLPVIRGGDQGSATTRSLPVNRLISYGACNVACPYCKRDCQFIDASGNVIASASVPLDSVLKLCLWAIEHGETPRFSGGDPVSFKRETLAIAEYVFLTTGKRVSIAHNGTWGESIRELVPWLSSAAIDLKATPEMLGKIMGVRISAGGGLYRQSLQTQSAISSSGVLLDVRTPVFGDTATCDMLKLGQDIAAVNDLRYTFWTWRLYKRVEGCDWSVPELQTVTDMMLLVSRQLPGLWLGMRAKWQAGGMIYFRDGKQINFDSVSDAETPGSGNRDLRPSQ